LFSWVPSRIEENPLTDLIATALNDPNPDVRGQAADVLGEVKDPRSVERLIENLKEEANPDVRVRIVVALRKIGLKTAVPALQTQLDRETEQEVVDWIKKALESIDQKK
jgi:HEAT repeat protein